MPADDAPLPFLGALSPPSIARPALLDVAAVRVAVASDRMLPPVGLPDWTRDRSIGDLGIHVNPHALPRAYVVERARFVGHDGAALEALGAADFAPHEEGVLVGSPTDADERQLADGPRTPASPALFVRDDPEHVVVDVAAATRPALLVLADAWAPGWR